MAQRPRLSFSEREQLSNCRFYSLFAAPAGLALIAFSLMLTVAKLGLSGRPIPEGVILLGNWLLAPIVSAALVFWLHPIPQGRWWKALLAAALAIPSYYLAFFAIAYLGMQLDLYI